MCYVTHASADLDLGRAGINITFRLKQLFDLRNTKGGTTNAPPTSAAGMAFAQLLTYEVNAFEELYVATFEVLDRQWLAARATYMQFPMVLDEAISAIKKAVLAKPNSIIQVRQSLDLQHGHV
jgi:ELMO/CED-12 family